MAIFAALKAIRYLLWPLAALFAVITGTRRWLYERGYWFSYQAPIPTIVIGNLSTGGTGKTPTVAYLITELQKAWINVGVVSRGYGRKSKGVFEVSAPIQAKLFGDEPSMLNLQFPYVPIFVAEDRAVGIKALIHTYPEVQAILLDDAFQHFGIKPSFRILLTTQKRPFWKDHVLPFGNLREPRASAKFADAIVLTKITNAVTPQEAQKCEFGLKFTYALPSNVQTVSKVWLVAGLADNANFFADIKALHPQVVGESSFKDHHDYTVEDIQKIIDLAQAADAHIILTTAKDAIKLEAFRGDFESKSLDLQVVHVNFEPVTLPNQTANSVSDMVISHIQNFKSLHPKRP